MHREAFNGVFGNEISKSFCSEFTTNANNTMNQLEQNGNAVINNKHKKIRFWFHFFLVEKVMRLYLFCFLFVCLLLLLLLF